MSAPAVAMLDTPPSVFDEEQTEAVRDCLRQITDDERAGLWGVLELLARGIDAADVNGVTAALGAVPDGPLRLCLLRVATPFLAANRERPGSGVQHRAPGYVYGRARPDFLGMFRGLTGTVAPVETWASRNGLYWEKTDADAFGAVNTSRHHEPVPLDYRHNPAVILGCSRLWALDGSGGLTGRFEMGSYPAAQQAARLAQRGDLGLSMSVRFRTRWLAHPAPDEWDPAAGVLDVCIRDAASVEAVALTPLPTYPSATVSRVW